MSTSETTCRPPSGLKSRSSKHGQTASPPPKKIAAKPHEKKEEAVKLKKSCGPTNSCSKSSSAFRCISRMADHPTDPAFSVRGAGHPPCPPFARGRMLAHASLSPPCKRGGRGGGQCMNTRRGRRGGFAGGLRTGPRLTTPHSQTAIAVRRGSSRRHGFCESGKRDCRRLQLPRVRPGHIAAILPAFPVALEIAVDVGEAPIAISRFDLAAVTIGGMVMFRRFRLA